MKNTIFSLALLLSITVCASSFAAPTWICSVSEAVAIDEDGTIGPPDLGGLDAPTFLRVDADNKAVTLLAPESRSGETTRINSVHEEDGIWVFAGVEEGRAWSMVISAAGYMTLSVTSDGGTWSVFGNALLEDD